MLEAHRRETKTEKLKDYSHSSLFPLTDNFLNSYVLLRIIFMKKKKKSCQVALNPIES